MKEEISNILSDLKEIKIGASKIEKDLSLANGVLGKTAKGLKGLSVANYEKVINYHKNAMNNTGNAISNVKNIDTVIPPQEKNIGYSKDKINKAKEAIDKLNKNYGMGTVMYLGGNPVKMESISTGSLKLDAALGIGGLPKGRIIEIYGPESSGKTTLALHIIAEAQKQKGLCAFIDAEHAFDETYAENLGVDIKNLLISQPDFGEQGLEVADTLICTGSYAVVVIDSVAALVPKAELEGEMGDSKMGLHARLMSQAMRKMAASVSKTSTILIFINQLREKIGVMFGNPETTTGGNALKFYASVRLDIRRLAQIKDGDKVVGNNIKVKVVKNKVSAPFKIAEFNIMYGTGIDNVGELVDLAVENGIIEKSGSWYSYKGDKLGQGTSQIKQLFIDNEELRNEIQSKLP